MIGFRHHPDCRCGCQHVVGLEGEIVRDDDTPRLAKLGCVYVRFRVPSRMGGPDRSRVVCYLLDKIGELR